MRIQRSPEGFLFYIFIIPHLFPYNLETGMMYSVLLYVVIYDNNCVIKLLKVKIIGCSKGNTCGSFQHHIMFLCALEFGVCKQET
jgi:hypothetical protein